MTSRTADGDLVGAAVPYNAGDPATPQLGEAMAGSIYDGSGDLVGRVALFQVDGGVAVPAQIVSGSTVGQPGGPAGPLDANGEIPLAQIPIDGLNFQGAWDASTNTPTLADGVGTAGDMYRVAVAGTQDLGSGPLTVIVGDHLIYEGTTWQQFSPPPALAWGDITGTLANQTDLQAALDGKVTKGGDVGGLTIGTTSNDRVDLITAGVILLTTHNSVLTASADLHMSEKKVINIADGTDPRDAVNRQQLDAATTSVTVATHSDGADIALTPTDATLQIVDAAVAVAAIVVTLPDATANTPAGKVFTVKMTNPGGNGIDVNAAGAANIDGDLQHGMAAANAYRTFVFDGTNWWITGSSGN